MKARSLPAPVLALALVVPLLTAIPTWQGYHYQSPPDRVFMGFRYMVGDHYVYAAFMREARDGVGLFMYNPFCSEPQKNAFVLPYFWLIGRLAAMTGVGILFWWEVLKAVGCAVYVLVFWWFAGTVFDKGRQRLVATVLFTFAGGLDWIIDLLRRAGVSRLARLGYAYDYYWNWSTFGTMQVPHWIWPAVVLLVAARTTVSHMRWRDAVLFVTPPLVWFLHPYSGMVAYLTFGMLPIVPVVTALASRERMAWIRCSSRLRVALPALLSFAVVAGYLGWARSDALFLANSEMGFLWNPIFSVGWYPLSYGLLLPLAWLGVRAMIREKSMAADVLLAWLAAAFMLSTNQVYAGVKFQYLMFPPLVTLAVRGLYDLGRASPFVQRLLSSRVSTGLLVALLSLNAPLSLFKDMPQARADPSIYLPSGAIDAMAWLDGQPEGVVLSSYAMGNRIPWLSGKRVYIGHWFMTPALDIKEREIGRFFSPAAQPEVRKRVLQESGASFVFLGPWERLDSVGLPLTRIYSSGGYTILRVDKGE